MKVEQISIDLDRILRAAERREKRLVEAFSATDEAKHQGLSAFGLAVVSRNGFLARPENRAAIAMAIDRAALTAAGVTNSSRAA